MHLAARAIYERGGLSDTDKERLRQAIFTHEMNFDGGVETLRQHAALTKLGYETLSGAEGFYGHRQTSIVFRWGCQGPRNVSGEGPPLNLNLHAFAVCSPDGRSGSGYAKLFDAHNFCRSSQRS